MRLSIRALAMLLPALGGCESAGTFPSLGPRAIEGLAGQPERHTTRPVRAADPALDAELATLAGQVDAADRDWAASLAGARAVIDRARGQPVGGELWVLAQQAIGRLDAARAPMTALVEALDRLRIAQAESATPSDDTRLAALWSRAVDLSTAENAAYAELAAEIPVS